MDAVLSLGIILLFGVAGGKFVKRFLKLPSVTGYIFAGILLGPTVLNIVDVEAQEVLQPISDVALGILAVAIGGELRFSALRSIWGDLCRVFFAESMLTFGLVAIITSFLANSIPMGLLFGMLSLASAPNTTIAIFREHRLKGNFPRTVLSLVALDNFICLLLFSILIGFFGLLWEEGNGGLIVWVQVFGKLILSFVLGTCLGFVMLYFNKRVKSDNELLVLSLGFVFLGVGLGNWLGMQPLFIAMVMGLVMVNLSKSSQRFFSAMQRVDTPILIAFLTLAGIKIYLGHIMAIGFLGAGYVLARFVGKLWGSRLGSVFCHKLPASHQMHLGSALIPQAGVAVGLSIMVERELPQLEGSILPVILGAVIFFEILGPILLKRSLMLTDSIQKD